MRRTRDRDVRLAIGASSQQRSRPSPAVEWRRRRDRHPAADGAEGRRSEAQDGRRWNVGALTAACREHHLDDTFDRTTGTRRSLPVARRSAWRRVYGTPRSIVATAT